MAEEITKMICITCPVGCTLEVTHEGKAIIKVDGHTCKKGIDYAEAELTDPRRMVTSTVKVRGSVHPLGACRRRLRKSPSGSSLQGFQAISGS